MAETLRHGNGVAEIVRDDRGALVALSPMPFDRRVISLLPSGRLAYDFTDPVTLTRRRLLDGEVLHLRCRSDDGLVGKAPHERASPVIAAALALQQHAGSMFEHGMFPAAAIELSESINQDGVDRLKNQLETMFRGAARSGKAIILPNGKWNSLSGSPVDQEILLARRFAGEEVARIYGVPPPIIGDLTHGTFSNSETMVRAFAMGTISQWARRLEAEFARSVFSRRSSELVIDLSGLLRGDPAQRWASWKIAVEAQILTANEVREAEGYNPRQGGDTFPTAASAQS